MSVRYREQDKVLLKLDPTHFTRLRRDRSFLRLRFLKFRVILSEASETSVVEESKNISKIFYHINSIIAIIKGVAAHGKNIHDPRKRGVRGSGRARREVPVLFPFHQASDGRGRSDTRRVDDGARRQDKDE